MLPGYWLRVHVLSALQIGGHVLWLTGVWCSRSGNSFLFAKPLTGVWRDLAGSSSICQVFFYMPTSAL